MGNGYRGHFTCAWRYTDKVRKGKVDDLGARNWSKNIKESMSASTVRHVRVSGTTERRSALDAGSVTVARARIERNARRRARMEDVLCANGYVGIVSDAPSSAKCEAPARLATHASAFAGAVAECSRVR